MARNNTRARLNAQMRELYKNLGVKPVKPLDNTKFNTNAYDVSIPGREGTDVTVNNAPSTGTGIFTDIANLYRTINYDMDKQNIDSKLSDISKEGGNIKDVERLQEYYNLVLESGAIEGILRNKTFNYDDPLQAQAHENLLSRLQVVNEEILKHEEYFRSPEGRSSDVIARNMYSSANMPSEATWYVKNSIYRDAVKGPGEIQLGWSKYGWAAGLAGGAIEGLGDLVNVTLGNAGRLLSETIGEAVREVLDIDYVLSTPQVEAATGDLDTFNRLPKQWTDYVKNRADDNNPTDVAILNNMFLGRNFVNKKDVVNDLANLKKEYLRDFDDAVENLIDAQDKIKNGRMFGINGMYDYSKVSEAWKRGRQQYQENGSFWDFFAHPIYGTADIASSLDMFRYQALGMGVDVLAKRLTETAFVKAHPGAAATIMATDVLTNVGTSVASRQEETGLEAISAMGTRVADYMKNNSTPEEYDTVMNEIRDFAQKIGVDADALDVDQLFKLGVAMDVLTGVRSFEQAKNDARQGINKLINANNTLAVADFAEQLPYMSYFGDVVKDVKYFGEYGLDHVTFGNKTLGQRLGVRNIPNTGANKYAYEQANRTIDAVFDTKLDKVVKRFVNNDAPKAALYTKHALQYAGRKLKQVIGSSIGEAIEEGQQTLLTNRYLRGEYDDYKKGLRIFDIGELVDNVGLAGNAVLDYFGLSGDPNMDVLDVQKAMNIGFWSSAVQGGAISSQIANLHGADEYNVRGLFKQLRNDRLATRILADKQKALLDWTHIDMFYDRFMHKADWSSMYESLSTLSKALDKNQTLTLQDGRNINLYDALRNFTDEEFEQETGHKKSEYTYPETLVKKEYIDDDIKLMTATWMLFSDDYLNKKFKEHGIKKSDEQYRIFLRNGATKLASVAKVLELISQLAKNLNDEQRNDLNIVDMFFNPNISTEEKKQIASDNPELFDLISELNASYRKYTSGVDLQNKAFFDQWYSQINDPKKFFDTVGGTEAIIRLMEEDGISERLNQGNLTAAPFNLARLYFKDENKRRLMLELAYALSSVDAFLDQFLNKKDFVNNKYLRESAKQYIGEDKEYRYDFEDKIDQLLGDIYDNKKKLSDENKQIIQNASELSQKPKDKIDFIKDRIRVAHQFAKRRAIEKNLLSAATESSILQTVREMTGLDIDPTKVKGWLPAYKRLLENLRQQEHRIVGNDITYEQFFNKDDIKLHADNNFEKNYQDYSINNAIFEVLAKEANVYRTLMANPTSMKEALFGSGVTGTYLDDTEEAFNKLIGNVRSDSEDLPVDDFVTRFEMQKLSEKTAWDIIMHQIAEQEKRNKIVHREFDSQSDAPVVERLGDENIQQQEDVERGGDDEVEDQEYDRARRELGLTYMSESGKKRKTQKELIEEAKEKRSKRNEESAKEEEPESQPEEESKPEPKPEPATEPELEPEPESELDFDDEPIEIESVDDEPIKIEPVVNKPKTEGLADDEYEEEEPINDEEGVDGSDEDGVDPINDDLEDDLEDYIDDEDDLTSFNDNNVDIEDEDGRSLSEEDQRNIRKELEIIAESEDHPVTIDNIADVGGEIEDGIGDPGVNLISSTTFYQRNATEIPIIKINGEVITEFNEKPILPGIELSKRLSQPGWLTGCKTYWVVTRPLEATNINPNDTDAFTVMLVIEDENNSYVTFLRDLGIVESISSTKKGRDGKPKTYHINSREVRANELRIQNMDVDKVLQYTGDKITETNDKLAKKQIVEAYKKAVNDYARTQFILTREKQDPLNSRAGKKAEKEWDSIKRQHNESDSEFEARKEEREKNIAYFNLKARLYFSKAQLNGKKKYTIFSEQQIQEELDILKHNRDEIINAYLTKDGEDYKFPKVALCGKVPAASVRQNNGHINSQKIGKKHQYRTLVEENVPMSEILQKLNSGEITLGLGRGARPKNQPYSIMKIGYTRKEGEIETIYNKGGVSGKVYWLVDGPAGGKVPIMLAEEKFDTQLRLGDDGKFEDVICNSNTSNRQVVLCIDPETKEQTKETEGIYKPSAAEVLFYMILNEAGLEQLSESSKSSDGVGSVSDVVSLFINATLGTILMSQPGNSESLFNVLAKKQLYYGPDVREVVEETEDGKTIKRKEAVSGYKFNIGLLQPDGTYRLTSFNKDDLIPSSTDTNERKEQIRENRQRVVQAIADNMHWNTDDFMLTDSASVDMTRNALGKLVRRLIEKDTEAGRFENMSVDLYLNSTVSIMGCPQLSFRIGDFYSKPKDTEIDDIDDLVEENGSVLAWMIKAGHLKTDAGKQLFKDAWVFASGAQSKNSVDNNAAADNNIKFKPNEPVKKQPVQKTEDTASKSDINSLYDESKSKRIEERIGRKMNLPKTKEQATNRIKELNLWIADGKSKGSPFGSEIDLDKNEILDAIILENREEDEIREFGLENGYIFVGEEGDKEFDDTIKKVEKDMVNSILDGFIEDYNRSHGTNITKDDIKENNPSTLYKRNNEKSVVDAVLVYRDKESGKNYISCNAIDSNKIISKSRKPEDVKRWVESATGVYSKAKQKGKVNEAHAREWLTKTLGLDPSQVIVIDALSNAIQNPEAYGVVTASVNAITGELFGSVMMRENAGYGIQYHEGWHYVNLIMHSKLERDDIYKAYLKTHPFLKLKQKFSNNPITKKEIEELLAEDFRTWMELQEDSSVKGRIRRAFRDMRDFMRIIIGKPLYLDVYKRISRGYYSGRKISQEDLLQFKNRYSGGANFIPYPVATLSLKERESFTEIERHQDYFEAVQAAATFYIQSLEISTEQDIARVNKQIKSVTKNGDKKIIDDIIEKITSWVDDSGYMTQDDKKMMKDVLRNPEKVMQTISDMFEDLGLKVKVKNLKHLNNDTDSIQEEKEGSLEESTEKEDAPDNTWDKFDLGVSKKDNASLRTKLFFKQIPVLRRTIDNNGDVKYVPERDRWGNIKMWNYNEAFNLILENLWQCESMDECDDKGRYLPTSLMGLIEFNSKSNPFFESVRQKVSGIKSNSFKGLILRSLLFTTINSNKPQAAFLQIEDPDTSKKSWDSYDDFSFDDDSDLELIRGGAARDIDRKWTVQGDSNFRAGKNIPRNWSKSLTGLGLYTTNDLGNIVVSKNYTDRLSEKLKAVRTLLDKYIGKLQSGLQYTDEQIGIAIRNEILPAAEDFYNEFGIPVDAAVLYNYIQSKVGDAGFTPKNILSTLDDIFRKSTKDNPISDNSIPRMADAVIRSTGKTTVEYGNDSRSRELDQIFNRFDENTDVFDMAIAVNNVHPSSREFSVKDPKGNNIYPISQNSFISDRTRKISVDKYFSKRMKAASKYVRNSKLLSISINDTDTYNKDTHFKLNAFVGIKDYNTNKGNDYFGISPLEDYIAKMIMTENDQIILPTMADKKTWYSISHKNLKLCHDTMLQDVYDDDIREASYNVYKKYNELPENATSDQIQDFKNEAYAWYLSLERDSEDWNDVYNQASILYNKRNSGVSIKRFSDDTLDLFIDYMRDELESMIVYYKPSNINYLVNTPSKLVENYHGRVDLTTKRMDFSGNGGKFRYFYDAIQFTDKSGKVYNLNLRLLFLYELQKEIEAGNIEKPDDPIFNKVTVSSIMDHDGVDGFELIRAELENIKDQYFKKDKLYLRNGINDILIRNTENELRKISDPSSPYKLAEFANGTFKPTGIPEQLLDKYTNKISKKISNENTKNSYTNTKFLNDGLYSLIANYVANSAISTIEFEKVFSGDPAFYKHKNAADAPKTKIAASVEIGGHSASALIKVDNEYDTFSDKIKRLGSTLSPGDEVRVQYNKEELEKHPELALTLYTNMYVEDINAKSTFIDTISYNFKRQLLIDSLRTTFRDDFSQYAAAMNMSFEKAIHKMYYSTKFFDTVYNSFKTKKNQNGRTLEEAILTELEYQIKPYNDINVCDAQVFIRPDLYRRIRIGIGQWTSDDEQAYQILERSDKYRNGEWMDDEKICKAVLQLEIYPLKMTYFQNDPPLTVDDKQDNDGYIKPALGKMAIFPLFRFHATNDTSMALYERMNRKGNQLDMISFKSAVKVGAVQNGAQMSEEGSSVKDQIAKIGKDFYKKSSLSIDRDPKSATFGKISRRHNNSVPVEVLDLRNLRFQLNTESHSAESRNIGTQMFKIAFSNIIDDAVYGANENGDGGRLGSEIKKDIMRCVKKLTHIGIDKIHKQFFKQSGESFVVDEEKVSRAIKKITESNGLGFNAEDLINSGAIASSTVSRQVFENTITKIVESEVVDISTNGGSAILQSVFGFVGYGKNNVKTNTGAYKINYNNGEELKWDTENGTMEVMLSMNFFRHVLPKEYKDKPYLELRRWLIDNDIIKGTKTDGTQSNPKPFGIGYRIPTLGMSSMFGFTVADVLPKSVGDLIIVPREFTAQTGSDFDVDKLYLATYSYKDGKRMQEQEGVDDNLNKGVYQNKLLDNYIDIICDKKNYADARASIDVFTSILKKRLINAKGVLRSPQDQYISSFTELTPSFQCNRKMEFSVGKDGIAPFALNVTNLALTQYCHLTMHYTRNVEEYGFGPLDAIYGKDGKRISGWLSAMVNAHVDVAKDPYIFDLNINKATYNYANFLLRAGMGLSTFTFLAQRSIKNVAQDIVNSGGVYGGNLEGSEQDPAMLKINARKAILKEYGRISKQLDAIEKQYSGDAAKSLSEETMKILKTLKEYVDFAKLSDRKQKDLIEENKKKSEDYKAPLLNYDRSKVFDENFAIDIIKLRTKSDLNSRLRYIAHQLACLRCFSEISGYAQGISSLVSNSQVDTKKFGDNITDLINSENKLNNFTSSADVYWTINLPNWEEDTKNRLHKNGTGKVDRLDLSKEALNIYFNTSYLQDKFTNTIELIRQILSGQLVTATGAYKYAFTGVFKYLNGGFLDRYNDEYNRDKIKSIGQSIDNILRFNILFNAGNSIKDQLNSDAIDFTLGGDISAVINKLRQLMIGDDANKPLYKRVAEMLRKFRYDTTGEFYDIAGDDGKINNEFMNILMAQAPNKNNPIGGLVLLTSIMDADPLTRQKLSSAFSQLINSENDEVRQLATDIAMYAYYSTYDQNVRNSFFELIPPRYRELYDKSLKSTLQDLNSQDADIRALAESNINGTGTSLYDDGRLYSNSIDVLRLLDIISRNYWNDDNIVPRYYPRGRNSSNRGIQDGNVNINGQAASSNGVFGFPQYIITNNRINGGALYFKIKIDGETLLYRKIGEIIRTRKDIEYENKVPVYAPVPKAGYTRGGIKSYEFYCDFNTPSMFPQNRISSDFAHDRIKEHVESLIGESEGNYELNAVWDPAPDVYNRMNEETYTNYDSQIDSETINRVRISISGTYRDQDTDKIKIKRHSYRIQDSASTIINFTTSEDPLRKYIHDEFKDKCVDINIEKPLSEGIYNKIKDSVSGSNRALYINWDDVNDINVTDQEVEEYIRTNVDRRASNILYLNEHKDEVKTNIKCIKMGAWLDSLILRLKQDGTKDIILWCSYFKFTGPAKVIKYPKQKDPDFVNSIVFLDSDIYLSKLLKNRLRRALSGDEIGGIDIATSVFDVAIKQQLDTEKNVIDAIEKTTQQDGFIISDDDFDDDDVVLNEVESVVQKEVELSNAEDDLACGFGISEDDDID